MEIDEVLRELLEETSASRVTLRQDVSGDYAFPVTHEALASGVPSLREERAVNLKTQPVVLRLRTVNQVVQEDCAAEFDDPAFQRMLETYGGLAAQIVTRVVVNERLTAILSLHQLGRPRRWTNAETEACRSAAARIGELL
jgi:GAF domain-containing protein